VAFISYVPRDEAGPDLKPLYDKFWEDEMGDMDHILRIHSHNPKSMVGHYEYYRHIMKGPSPLSRPQREMLAVVVSALNHCHY